MRAAAMEGSTADDKPNWSELPEDMLLTAMSAMDALDVVRSSAVCSRWRSTYATLRRLRLPSSKQQSPCLLYPRPRPRDASGGPDIDPDNAPLYLYSPSADATFRMRLPHDALVLAGSAHGWLFATDQVANPYLLNPLTGARAPLPPVTTFQCVVGSSLDGHGNIVYHVDDPSLQSASYGDDDERIYSVPARRARSWMYRHVALSAGGADPSCVVLVVHEWPMDLYFASPGDGRWSSLSSLGYGFISAVYNDKDGLFYVLECCGTVHALDLHHGHGSSCSRVVARTQRLGAALVSRLLCLAVAPCGDVLLVARKYWLLERLDVHDDFDGGNSFSVYKLDLGAKEDKKKPEKLEGIGDQDVLLLGDKSSALCAKINMEDCPRLRTNCAYLADFISREFLCDQRRIITRRDIGFYWDFESEHLHNIAHLWPAHHLELELPDSAPAPIWITPSPF